MEISPSSVNASAIQLGFAKAEARKATTLITEALSKAEGCTVGAAATAAIFPIVLPLVLARRSAHQTVEERDRTIRALELQVDELRKQLTILWDHKTGGDLAANRAAIEALIGLGFNSNQTLRRLAQTWLAKLEEAYPGDTLMEDGKTISAGVSVGDVVAGCGNGRGTW